MLRGLIVQGINEDVKELISAIRSINYSKCTEIKILGDDEPCYYQRKEWIDWILELVDGLEEKIGEAMIKIQNNDQSVIVELGTSKFSGKESGVWSFCENGYQSVSTKITLEMFDMIRELSTNHKVFEFYEELRKKNEK